jgi:hypothetical protein
MAAANENQGLKIAVAAFVALTVILAVTTYFGFSNYAQADAQRKAADEKAAASVQKATQYAGERDDLKQAIGVANVEDPGQVKDAIKKHYDKVGTQLAELQKKVQEQIAEYKTAGGNATKIDELQGALNQVVTSYNAEPNKTYQSAMDRMMELMGNVTQLMTGLTVDNESLRRDLEKQNQENASQLEIAKGAAKKAEDGKNQVTTQNEQERTGLLGKVDQLQTMNTQLNAQVAALQNDITRQRGQFENTVKELQRQLRYYREQSEKSEVVLDKPSGRITYYDPIRNEVRVNLTRQMGAREQMVFSVFDRTSPGLPTDTPKAVIELIQVGNQDSVARIDRVKTLRLMKSPNYRTGRAQNTIRVGDLIYSPAFSPSDKMRFALIGKIDVNRDGFDDRDDLRRMIEAGGGEVAYDLPPAGLGRKESGSLDGPIAWYVIDERNPIKPPPNPITPAQDDEKAFEEKKAEARQKLRDAGVRPISIDRLLAMLGYTYGAPIASPGKVEKIDQETVRGLLETKKGAGGQAPAATTTPPATEDKPAGDAEKKDEGDKPEGDKDNMPK